MIKLTLREGGDLWVSPPHVVSIRNSSYGSFLQTTKGAYQVNQAPEQVLRQLHLSAGKTEE